MKLTPGRVLLEGSRNPGCDDGSWPALLARGSWNGWAIPFFDEDTAKELVHVIEESQGVHAEIDHGAVRVTTEGASAPREEFIKQMLDGTPLYPIGAWSWCWERVA